MKSTTTLLVASLLLLLSAAVVAADLTEDNLAARAAAATNVTALAAPAPAAVEPVIGISPVRSSGHCASSAAPFFTAAWAKSEDSSLLPNQCGDCSGICSGKTRGMQCVIPGPNGGFGNCNIYSGGERCENGGWACQCGRGPLP